MKLTNSSLAFATLALSLSLTQAGCSQDAPETAIENPALATPVPAGMVRGAVLETMDAGGYTYVLMDTEDGHRWAAGPTSEVQVGDVVQTTEGMAMSGFQSKSLNRSFDVVYFTDTLENLSASAAVDPTAALPEGHPPLQPAGDIAPLPDTAVEAFEEGKDIAWLHANKDSLAGQSVSLRGTVVKYNPGILGWNFLHIQDGSGDAAGGSNDLTVTSKTEVAVGQTVVVTGNIILDKDFGAGYSFPVMMEDATIVTE
jgi:hypothetical protein